MYIASVFILFELFFFSGKKVSAQDFTNAIELNGSSSYVQANTVSNALNNTNEITLEVWVKPYTLDDRIFVLTFHETVTK